MEKGSRIAVLVPAYQPSEYVVAVVRAIVAGLPHTERHIFVINDGSTEGIAHFEAIALDFEGHATVLTHEENRGKGAALKTGIAHALQDDSFSHFVTVDADGQHHIDDIRAVIQEARSTPHALVLGARQFSGDVPLRSRLGNAITRTVFRFFTGTGVSDTQTGLRAFNTDFAERIRHLKKNRYDFEQEMLIHATERGTKIAEVPISTIYIEHNASSHFRPLIDSARIYWLFIKYSLSSLFGIALDFTMFFTLFYFTQNILLSNLIARITTMPVNYYINKWFVFGNQAKYRYTFPQYVLLAGINPFFSSGIMYMLTAFGLPIVAAKVIAESCMFVINYLVQLRLFTNIRRL